MNFRLYVGTEFAYNIGIGTSRVPAYKPFNSLPFSEEAKEPQALSPLFFCTPEGRTCFRVKVPNTFKILALFHFMWVCKAAWCSANGETARV